MIACEGETMQTPLARGEGVTPVLSASDAAGWDPNSKIGKTTEVGVGQERIRFQMVFLQFAVNWLTTSPLRYMLISFSSLRKVGRS